jgi:uncharacterized protein GlcG (DUF336 family)
MQQNYIFNNDFKEDCQNHKPEVAGSSPAPATKSSRQSSLLAQAASRRKSGCLMIVAGGKIIDGNGCSDETGTRDIQICEAGLAALK